MTYDEVRPRIQSGDLLAWSHRAWRSWYDLQIQIVRMFTRSEYCHVGVAWTVANRVFALEAVGTGVRIMPLSLLRPFYRIPLASWGWPAEEFALAQIGRPYSKLQAIAAGVGMLRIGADAKWQCAEYVIEVLRRANYDLSCEATPSAVVQAALQRGAFVRYIE